MMRHFVKNNRITSLWITFILSLSLILNIPLSYSQEIMPLPFTGTVSSQSVLMRGIQLDQIDPFDFHFIVDSGGTGLEGDDLKKQSEELVRYFFSALTIPEKELWVNLSPYEADRMIPNELGLTELGRDLLSQDYVLKQLTSSLFSPENELGKKFWEKIYSHVRAQVGAMDISVETLNKVWIVPEKAVVYQQKNTAVVVESRLKVMLQEDYLAKNVQAMAKEENSSSALSTQMIREIILPQIEKEVNEGESFAKLRQIYHSVILATWYKNALKNLITEIYADKNKTEGIQLEDQQAKEKIYQQYLETFKKGAYDSVKEEYDPVTQQIIPRKYFSGGVKWWEMSQTLSVIEEPAMLSPQEQSQVQDFKNSAQLGDLEVRVFPQSAGKTLATAFAALVDVPLDEDKAVLAETAELFANNNLRFGYLVLKDPRSGTESLVNPRIAGLVMDRNLNEMLTTYIQKNGGLIPNRLGLKFLPNIFSNLGTMFKLSPTFERLASAMRKELGTRYQDFQRGKLSPPQIIELANLEREVNTWIMDFWAANSEYDPLVKAGNEKDHQYMALRNSIVGNEKVVQSARTYVCQSWSELMVISAREMGLRNEAVAVIPVFKTEDGQTLPAPDGTGHSAVVLSTVDRKRQIHDQGHQARHPDVGLFDTSSTLTRGIHADQLGSFPQLRGETFDDLLERDRVWVEYQEINRTFFKAGNPVINISSADSDLSDRLTKAQASLKRIQALKRNPVLNRHGDLRKNIFGLGTVIQDISDKINAVLAIQNQNKNAQTQVDQFNRLQGQMAAATNGASQDRAAAIRELEKIRGEIQELGARSDALRELGDPIKNLIAQISEFIGHIKAGHIVSMTLNGVSSDAAAARDAEKAKGIVQNHNFFLGKLKAIVQKANDRDPRGALTEIRLLKRDTETLKTLPKNLDPQIRANVERFLRDIDEKEVYIQYMIVAEKTRKTVPATVFSGNKESLLRELRAIQTEVGQLGRTSVAIDNQLSGAIIELARYIDNIIRQIDHASLSEQPEPITSYTTKILTPVFAAVLTFFVANNVSSFVSEARAVTPETAEFFAANNLRFGYFELTNNGKTVTLVDAQSAGLVMDRNLDQMLAHYIEIKKGLPKIFAKQFPPGSKPTFDQVASFMRAELAHHYEAFRKGNLSPAQITELANLEKEVHAWIIDFWAANTEYDPLVKSGQEANDPKIMAIRRVIIGNERLQYVKDPSKSPRTFVCQSWSELMVLSGHEMGLRQEAITKVPVFQMVSGKKFPTSDGVGHTAVIFSTVDGERELYDQGHKAAHPNIGMWNKAWNLVKGISGKSIRPDLRGESFDELLETERIWTEIVNIEKLYNSDNHVISSDDTNLSERLESRKALLTRVQKLKSNLVVKRHDDLRENVLRLEASIQDAIEKIQKVSATKDKNSQAAAQVDQFNQLQAQMTMALTNANKDKVKAIEELEKIKQELQKLGSRADLIKELKGHVPQVITYINEAIDKIKAGAIFRLEAGAKSVDVDNEQDVIKYNEIVRQSNALGQRLVRAVQKANQGDPEGALNDLQGIKKDTGSLKSLPKNLDTGLKTQVLELLGNVDAQEVYVQYKVLGKRLNSAIQVVNSGNPKSVLGELKKVQEESGKLVKNPTKINEKLRSAILTLDKDVNRILKDVERSDRASLAEIELEQLESIVLDQDSANLANPVGGIDLSADKWSIEVQGEKMDFGSLSAPVINPFDGDPSLIDGMTPIVIKMTPFSNFHRLFPE